MRRSVLFLALALTISMLPAAAATAEGPGPGGFTTNNVTWVKNLPETVAGTSGRVVKVGEQLRFYTTGAKGLFIYNITDPANPVLLGALPLPHVQNEDVEVSADGSRTLISADGALLVPLIPSTAGLHIIDTSNPAAPKEVGYINNGSAALPGGDHTASCADPACNWVYGSEGNTYNITNPAAPVKLTGAAGWQGAMRTPTGGKVTLTQGAHDMSRDAAGLISTDTIPRLILDPRVDPAKPVIIARSGTWPNSKNLTYQHNSLRPRADQWVARNPLDPADHDNPALRPGELLLANGETNIVPQCNGSGGPLASWSMRNFNEGASAPMTNLETFRPLRNGNYADGNPAVNALGCSGHYFDERNNMIAAAWFEHGTRFIEVDPTTGKFTERGYWQPVVGSAGAAYWINDEYVYVTDYIRGVDIIKFNRTAPPASQEELDANWLASLNAKSPAAPVSAEEQYRCSLAIKN
jgi:hypothetical protein